MVVDVFQDTVCPWCRIGKKHLKDALARWDGAAVTVRYHPFFLNPTIPEEGYEFLPYMRAKFRADDLTPMFEGPRRAGAAAGLVFNFDRMTRAPNSVLSHRLIMLAGEQQETLIDAIYDAYFEHGRDIGSLSVLLDIAEACGLERAALAEQLGGDAGRAEVLGAAQWAAEMGISGVPLFIFNGAFAVSGAHPPDTLLAALKQASGATPRFNADPSLGVR
jgi:predicted DsbA family dithiol-disulfide isomerase